MIKAVQHLRLKGALLALALVPGLALADANLAYHLAPATNYPGSDYLSERARFLDDARWAIAGLFDNLPSGYTVSNLPAGEYIINFRIMGNYYTPSSVAVTIENEHFTNTALYQPFSNSFTIVVEDDHSNALDAAWSLLSWPANFTNSFAWLEQGTNGVGEEFFEAIPTGTYTLAFQPVVGYTTPSRQTNTITGADAPVFTGTYNRIRGTIIITNTPAHLTNFTWEITAHPEDYTNLVTGTGYTVISNAPSGEYTLEFDDIPGYFTPPSQTLVVSNRTVTLVAPYATGPRLRVVIYDHDHPQDPTTTYRLAGVGTGTYTVAGAAGTFNGLDWYFAPDADITLTALPEPLTIETNTYDSFFYRWYEIWGTNRYVLSSEPTFSVRMEEHAYEGGSIYSPTYDRLVYLMFSREYYPHDNVGDLDGDGLPDEWEIAYGLDPESADGIHGAAGNPDGDWIPSRLIGNPARYVYQDTNMLTCYYSSSGGSAPAYPLSGERLYNPDYGAHDGYARTNTPFDNWLECRGMDDNYKTNGPNGWCPDDDPRTSPFQFDSLDDKDSSDGISDGWRYYFWYWRSITAYEEGITNSAGLSWVYISPTRTRPYVLRDWDTDGDGLTDEEEYLLGTDPTHADTDGDSMDDYWEVHNPAACHPLNASDGMTNIDLDYFACSTNLQLLGPATYGLIQGTPLQGTLCIFGGMDNILGAWIDTYTDNGPGRFDLYHDQLLMTGVTDSGWPALLRDGTLGQPITDVVYFGMEPGLPFYRSGDPVWIRKGSSSYFSAGDIPIVNPYMKHDWVYKHQIDGPFPGLAAFDPRTAWCEHPFNLRSHPNTLPYVNYQEYMGGDYYGRVSWNAGGRVISQNDPPGKQEFATAYTDPASIDTDEDLIPDGWELYVGMNPNFGPDSVDDDDEDGLLNREEWSNATDDYNSCRASWPNKIWPTDPGVVTNGMSPLCDPHPYDTDWDGLSDGDEKMLLSNPTSADTDGDMLPDGWEVYAGTDINVSDAFEDPDGDGLENWREYWTGTVAEWQKCDPAWGVKFCTRRAQPWDPMNPDEMHYSFFIPPDFFTCPSFLYLNNVFADISDPLAYLRTNYPAAHALPTYHTTTLADNPDSDGDGMDDYWEVYHGLNPLKGALDLVSDNQPGALTGSPDAAPYEPGFQFGTDSQVFRSLRQLIEYLPMHMHPPTAARAPYLAKLIGPFNFGLGMMDPDGDGLPNFEEYSYNTNRVFYHTDPTPLWRTDSSDSNSFVSLNYTRDYYGVGMSVGDFFVGRNEAVFHYEVNEGFDTDNDGVGDYFEVNTSSGLVGSDPLDARNPIRNRALAFNGVDDFARTLDGWFWTPDSVLSRFCVEAWVCPANPAVRNQVVVERAGTYPHPYQYDTNFTRANFCLGITNGLPYVMYNGRGAMPAAYQATARVAHRLRANTWAHIAGSYDGTNLIIYVNGEASSATRTTELPATGYDYPLGTNANIAAGTPHSIMVGARDASAGELVSTGALVRATDYYAGLIDEVRIWDGTRTRDQIMADQHRRLSVDEITNSSLKAYFTFDDVPDPQSEGIVPAGMDILDPSLKFHPPIGWWTDYPLRSRVYTGSAASPYNYLVSAENHYAHRPVLPPRDDRIHFPPQISTNEIVEGEADDEPEIFYNLPEGYRNVSNPYGDTNFLGQAIMADLCLFMGTRAVTTNSWLLSLSDNPDDTDSDGDGLPDWWEILYGLDPYDATGENGAWGDPDGDGLSNLAEYHADTNPRAWDTDGDGISDYDSRGGPAKRTWGELYDDGDGMPDWWEVLYGLDPNIYDAHLDKDGDGWSNYAEFMAETDPSDPNSYPTPGVKVKVHYQGAAYDLDSLIILGYQTEKMDGAPVAVAYGIGPGAETTISGLKEGEFYLFGFLDLNGNGVWDPHEPCGVAYDQPHYLAWADMDGVHLGLRDPYPGYGRFAWEAQARNSTVVINKISAAGGPLILKRSLRAPRNYFHEWDYQMEGFYGLGAGTYQWWVGSQNGTFEVRWPASLSRPRLIAPRGDVFYYARGQLAWTMDNYATYYHVQVANAAYNILTNYYLPAPYPDKDGIYRDHLPFYLGEWGNGAYYWRLAAGNPNGESAWSEVQTFNINLTSTNSLWISGQLYYFGKAHATNIYVEAFTNPGFSGEPEARVLCTPACTADPMKTSFIIRGLKRDIYYLRAFIDTTPVGGARNHQLDYWESWGFVKDPHNDYYPRAIDLISAGFVGGTKIILRDRDTDNDLLPDAWEMSYFGSMNQTGDMDYDKDGLDNITEYALDLLDTDPTLFDTDGDGLPDLFEATYGGPEYDPYDPVYNPTGKSLNPTRWDTDGDGYSDGAELRRYHTDPLDPNSYPRYAPPCYGPCASPADYDGDGRSDASLYSPTDNIWSLVTWQGQIAGRFGTAITQQPLLGDYDGDGRTDVALYDAASGAWYIYTWQDDRVHALSFGDAQMIPVPADYDGDFRTDLGVYDLATGIWHLYSPHTRQYAWVQFGNANCIPVPGDYDGDGCYDLAVYHLPDQTWHIQTARGQYISGDPFGLGHADCIPVPGDYDGDGRYDVALYEVPTGIWHAYTWKGFASMQFGWPGVIPVPGDYDGDGRRDLGLYDPATGVWYIHTIAGQRYEVPLGWPGAVPVTRGR